jgi:hypothetical protein
MLKLLTVSLLVLSMDSFGAAINEKQDIFTAALQRLASSETRWEKLSALACQYLKKHSEEAADKKWESKFDEKLNQAILDDENMSIDRYANKELLCFASDKIQKITEASQVTDQLIIDSCRWLKLFATRSLLLPRQIREQEKHLDQAIEFLTEQIQKEQ